MKKELVEFILRHALDYRWTVQGLGMLRLYINPSIRLHIWDNRIQVPDVTLIHTHPWDFTSQVIAGRLKDHIYEEIKSIEDNSFPAMKQRIQCGVGACLVGKPEYIHMKEKAIVHHSHGHLYRHFAEDIHYTEFQDGTVTVITRKFKKDTEHAYVYMPNGEPFVSAEPIEATTEQVYGITQTALSNWFK